MFRPFIAAALLFASVAAVPWKVCLDACSCEYDDSNPVIRCENGDRTTLFMPRNPMDIFEIIALPCNDIHSLPSGELLRAAFPDLKIIDVEGNPNFNCSQVAALEEHEIVVNSDCGKEKKLVCSAIDNKNCDWKCRTLEKIKELWKKFKETVSKKAKDWQLEETMQNMQDWFSHAFDTVSKKFSS